MAHLRLLGTALTFSMLVAGGCSDPAEDAANVPTFEGVAGPGTAAPGAPAPGAGNAAAAVDGSGAPPAATPAGTPPAPGTPSPTPGGSEQPPATSGLDTSGAASPGQANGGAGGGAGTPAPPSTTPPSATPPAGSAASAGCGLAQGAPQNLNVDSTIITLPQGYDGSTPVPLAFGFHGAGRTNLDQQMVDSRTVGSDLEKNYVLAYVKSAGNAWDLNTDYPRFAAIRTQILSQLCIDTAHIFAFGHSSGAQFIVQMLGSPSTRERGFAAVAPVSSSRYPNPAWDPVPTLLIHGLNDTQRPNDADGADDIAQYAESNLCNGQTTPLAVPQCTSFTGDATVNPGCRQYEGCAAPTLFCNHDDPNYRENGNPTNHGWPCFANSQIFQFFESQR